MKNWSTDVTTFKTQEQKTLWEYVQCMNYGFDGKKPKKKEMRRLWGKLAPHLNSYSKRLWEVWLWDRVYSLTSTESFFWQSPKMTIS